MAGSDSESSSSGSGSGSSSRSPSPSAPSLQSSTQRLNASNNTSNTSSYIPPPFYEPASFSNALTIDDIKSASSKGKQIWTIKVPDGVHPSLLEGLVFDLPPTRASSSSSSTPLGSLKTSNRDTKTGEKKSTDVYHLYHSNPNSKAPTSEDAKNAKPGHKGKKAKKEGNKSQLVSEQEQQEEIREGNNFGAHMNGLRAYVAVPGGRPGQISAAPLPISHHLEFVLSSPTTISSKSKKESKSDSVKEEQPQRPLSQLRELKGYFAPSGSLYDDGQEETVESIATEKNKKRKKDQVEVEASPSSSKSKKVKVRDEDGGKKDKDKKKSSKHSK